MGQYINVNSKGESIGTSYQDKVNNLVADGATIVSGTSYEPNLVCVVNNGSFAAAGYMYSESEYRVFSNPDGRPKTWLVHPQASELAD